MHQTCSALSLQCWHSTLILASSLCSSLMVPWDDTISLKSWNSSGQSPPALKSTVSKSPPFGKNWPLRAKSFRGELAVSPLTSCLCCCLSLSFSVLLFFSSSSFSWSSFRYSWEIAEIWYSEVSSRSLISSQCVFSLSCWIWNYNWLL